MLPTCAAQIRDSISMTVREKDKVFVSVLVGVTLNQLEDVIAFIFILFSIIHLFFL